MSSVNVCRPLLRHWETVRYLALRPDDSVARTAVGLSVGIAMGLMPLLWGTSLLCFILAWTFGLNHILIQTLNYLLYPVQLSLLQPFFYFGGNLFGAPVFDIKATLKVMDTPVWELIPIIWMANLHALMLWCILSSVCIPVLCVLFSFILKHRREPSV